MYLEFALVQKIRTRLKKVNDINRISTSKMYLEFALVPEAHCLQCKCLIYNKKTPMPLPASGGFKLHFL